MMERTIVVKATLTYVVKNNTDIEALKKEILNGLVGNISYHPDNALIENVKEFINKE